MAQGFEQILPSKMRTGSLINGAAVNGKTVNGTMVNGTMVNGHRPIPRTVIDEATSPTILAPQPTTSRMLRASPATEYPVRSVSPDLIPDRMADRVVGVGSSFARRLTPNPDQQRRQQRRQNAVGTVGA